MSLITRMTPFFVLSLVVSTKARINFKMPFGTMMCDNLCNEIDECWRTVYVKKSLICHISVDKGMGYHKDVKNHIAIMNTLKPNRNMTQSAIRRLITTHKGNNVTVIYEIQEVRESGAATEALVRETDNNPTSVTPFCLRVPTKLKEKNCTLLSMARSITHPDLLYLLLDCRNVDTCFVRLYLMDLKTKWLVKGKGKWCDQRKLKRHILTGPCIKNKSNPCLFSISVASKWLTFKSYEEPKYRNLSTLWTEMAIMDAGYRSTPLCSMYKHRVLLCLMSGELYQLELNPKKLVPKRMKLDWNIPSFPHLRDFRLETSTDDLSEQSDAVIVNAVSVSVVSFDFKEKTVKEIISVITKAVTATLENGIIMVHGKWLDQPFYRCKTNKLFFCQDN